MTEIPDDVMKAAIQAYDKPLREDGSSLVYLVNRMVEDDVKLCIARAILAERERCAKVAYAYADAHTSEHKMIGHIIGRKILFDTVDDGS